MKKIIVTFIISLLVFNSYGQLNPSNQPFIFNPTMINPAFAGLHNDQVQLGYDTRWVGLDGAPKTAFIRFDKMFNGNTGWDVAIISDRIGPVSTISLANCFSYHIKLFKDTKLAFGLRHHLTQSSLNVNAAYVVDNSDPLLAPNQTGVPVNNFDASFALYNPDKYMIGFSYTNLIPQPQFRFTNTIEQPILSLHGWYNYDITDAYSLEAFGLLTTTNNTPLNTNIGLMGIMQHKFGVGLNFSPKNQLGVFAYIKASNRLQIFYNYNFPLSDISKISKQSHSIGIALRIGKSSQMNNTFLLQPTLESTRNSLF